MGKEKYQKEIAGLFERSLVVDAKSIARIINKNNTNQYSKQLIRNLIIKGKIKRLGRGYYTVYEDSSLAVFCFKPSYLGLQDALSFHNLWEQETIPVIITSKKIRQGIRKVIGGNVLIRRVEKKYLFGFEHYKEGEFYLPYSDLEKTFIDAVYFRLKLSEETVKNIQKRIDKRKLNRYLMHYPRRFREKVSRFLHAH